MANDDVTLAVLGQRMDQLLAQFTQLNASLEAERRHNSETFARKDVLDSRLDGIGNRITEAEKDIANAAEEARRQQARSRAMVIALIPVGVTSLISVISIILTVLGAGAAT